MRKKLVIVFVMLGLLPVLSGCVTGWVGAASIEITGEDSFIDSMGQEVTVQAPYQRVITLYSAHTENAYAIGAGHQIIGVGTTSIYPPEAAFLPRYDYKSDPEPVIAANPDLVIVRPFINRNYNDYVQALTKAGIEVVSLYPESSEEFDAYVTALGMLFGKEENTLDQLAILKAKLDAIEAITDQIPYDQRVHVYFESTKTAYRTVTTDSNPAKGIEIAGGINVATDVSPITRGSTIAEFGSEKLMLQGETIDVFVSQRGAMNSGGSLISIPQREGFRAIKAVDEGRILELNEKIISSPTFRYDKGVREMARMFYPDVMDDLTMFNNEALLDRQTYAELTVKFYHTPIFIPSSSHYYDQDHQVHNYGMFMDVPWTHEHFDWIETAVMNSYLRSHKAPDGQEYFDLKDPVTRGDLAYTLFIKHDIVTAENHQTIVDLALCQDQRIVQKVVDNGYMDLDEEGKFNPDLQVTGEEAMAILARKVTKD